jgi:hypothetical protein
MSGASTCLTRVWFPLLLLAIHTVANIEDKSSVSVLNSDKAIWISDQSRMYRS